MRLLLNWLVTFERLLSFENQLINYIENEDPRPLYSCTNGSNAVSCPCFLNIFLLYVFTVMWWVKILNWSKLCIILLECRIVIKIQIIQREVVTNSLAYIMSK